MAPSISPAMAISFNAFDEFVCVTTSEGKIEFANDSFSTSLLLAQRAKGCDFAKELFGGTDLVKMRVALSLVASAANPITELTPGLETLTLRGPEGFPHYRRVDWSVKKLQPSKHDSADDEKLLLVVGRFAPCSNRTLQQVVGENDDEGEDAGMFADSEFIDSFQKAPIALHWLSGMGRIIWCNERELEILGYTREEYIGHLISDFHCPGQTVKLAKAFEMLGSGQSIHGMTFKFRTKTGDIKYLTLDSNVCWNPDGSFRHTRCFLRENTTQQLQYLKEEMEKAAQKQIQEEKDKFIKSFFTDLRTTLHVLSNFLSSTDTPESPQDQLSHTHFQVESVISKLNEVTLATGFDTGDTVKSPLDITPLRPRIPQQQTKQDVVEKGIEEEETEGEEPDRRESQSATHPGHNVLVSRDFDNFTNDDVLQFVRLNNSANSFVMIFSQNSSLDEFYADQQGCTALMLAAELGHLELMTLLMDRGAVVSTQKHDGNSALHMASQHENVDAMQLLLQRDADINQVNALGFTALAEAAQNGVTLSLEFLINNYADVNLASDGDFSPVFLAAQGGHDEAVGMLISAGADVNASTARYTAVQSKQESSRALSKTQNVLENDSQGELKLDADNLTPLCIACIMGHFGIAQQLIAAGANVNHTSSRGMSPFSFAYNHYHQDILLMLIFFGAIPAIFSPCSDGSFSMSTAV